MTTAKQGGCFAFLFGRTSQKQARRKKGTPEILPYKSRDSLLTKAEISFYHVLRQTVANEVIICPKVRLLDLVYIPRNTPNSYTYINKVSAKHIDFVLCDPATMRPLVALELDDASHEAPDRRQRDAFVDVVFQTIHLPILHIPAKKGYAPPALRSLLAPYLPTP